MRSGYCLLLGLCAAVSLGLAGPARAAATLYKWVDAGGVTHYSDRPAPGAQQIRIANAQTFKSARTPPGARSPRNSSDQPAQPYSRIEITRPAEGESIVNTGGRVDASADLEPALAPGHQLWFVVDGTRQTDPAGASLTASLTVSRGTHSLAIAITDEAGRELVTSAPVAFNVVQASVGEPPRGPLITPPKPPPKKKP